jgi:Tfp pilus assembly protein PilV
MSTPSSRPRVRGFSLIETVLTISILTIGVLGIAQMQIIGVRSKNFATNIATASLLAHDLAEQAQRWSYTDSRLTPLGTVTSTTDASITALWDMGKATTVSTALKAEFSEIASDSNATTANALGTYQGVTAPAGFYRYWNVFAVDLTNGGTPQGKLVQIIVRWKEPGFGMRQVSASTYISNPTAIWQ